MWKIKAHLITASEDNVPTLRRVNNTYRRRFTENRHMSVRIVASVQFKYKRVPQNWETAKYKLQNKGPCERSEQTRRGMEHCRRTCSVRLPAPPQPSTGCRDDCLTVLRDCTGRLLPPCSCCAALVLESVTQEQTQCPLHQGGPGLRSVAGTRRSCQDVLSCLPWEGKFVRYVLTDDTRLARPELLEEVGVSMDL